ncbi:hypothetical protein FE257_002559 [Aspergillus nanangensis]|uniref:Uncharacterized protein n=1 Tax=Aspergillus nanangensis TaxID=2582783 RepID=A0AAD4GY12_ASPNN|nr:hypothetical protein FE257_002559 [Aspergillus nanangensis]
MKTVFCMTQYPSTGTTRPVSSPAKAPEVEVIQSRVSADRNSVGVVDFPEGPQSSLSSPGVYIEPESNHLSSPATPEVVSPEGLDQLSWPLESRFEASLLKYFLTTLSPWFDYCDPQQHFRTYIGNAAPTDITLLYAVLAVSARHQSSSLHRHSHIADEYQKRCLRSLIAALNDEANALKDTILASAVILRFFEEMTEPPEESIRTHTLSAQLLLRIREGHVYRSSFTDAAFLVVLRSETYVANMTQRPIGNLVDHCNIDTSLGPASEGMWALRAIAHAAKATDFAYGDDDDAASSKARWESLMQYVDDWERLCPPSFQPMYARPQISASNPFPHMWYANDYHVAARQHIELARVLLLASNAQSCLARIRQRRMGQSNDECIRDSVRIICGVCMSNPEFVPAQISAGLVIAICGELFDDPTETKILFQVLSDAESHLGWPCLKAKEYLRGLWHL